MIDFQEFVSSEKNFQNRGFLALPLAQPRKLTGSPCLGKMWPKQAKNGRLYYKLKFDCFARRNGKTFYARGWERKSQPGTFDIQAEERPFAARQPMLFNADNELPLHYIKCSDGSYLIMADYSFIEAD